MVSSTFDGCYAKAYEPLPRTKVLNCWRQKGPTGKLHNLILWIQKAPQRIQKFKDLTTEESDVRSSRYSFPQSD